MQLQRQLGLTRYETAFVLLHELRRAMRRPDRDRIAGTVEVDEAHDGGVDSRQRGGRQRDSNKSSVVSAVEVKGQRCGRLRLAVVPDLSADCLAGFVQTAVESGSIILTDVWQGYAHCAEPTTIVR